MKDEAFYFKHDCNAQNDLKLQRLVMEHGWAAYGLYWAIVERLQDPGNGGQILADIPALSWSLKADEAALQALISKCFYITTDGYIRSKGVDKRLAARADFIESSRRGGRKSASSRKSRVVEGPLKAPSTDLQLTLKGTSSRRGEERKGKEKKEQQTIAAAPASPTPEASEPNPLTPLQRVVGAYKLAKGIDRDDKAWDRANYARYSKAAKSLLEACGGNLEAAVAYLIGQGDEWDAKSITWTLETIARHAWDNQAKITEAVNGPEHRPLDSNNLLDERRTSRPTPARELAAGALRGIAEAGQAAPRLEGQGFYPANGDQERPDTLLARGNGPDDQGPGNGDF